MIGPTLSTELDRTTIVDFMSVSETRPSKDALPAQISALLSIDRDTAKRVIGDASRLYHERMRVRFSHLRVRERLKRTNPFLLRIRGLKTVRDWARTQVTSALFASEEEAVGHLLEAIAKWCHPGSKTPAYPDDFDYEVADENRVFGYQVKMSWDCMPMSSRKNLSNTIRHLTDVYAEKGQEFVGVFAPCYGKATTTSPPGQDYVSMGSRDFWARVGSGDREYDHKVGEVCALLCAEFRNEIEHTLVPDLVERLTDEAQCIIGLPNGDLNYGALFRAVNR